MKIHPTHLTLKPNYSIPAASKFTQPYPKSSTLKRIISRAGKNSKRQVTLAEAA